VAITEQRCLPATRAYIARRVAEGTTDEKSIRCIERYIADRVWRPPHAPNQPLTRHEVSIATAGLIGRIVPDIHRGTTARSQ
jgi:hypothetical protein